MKRLVWMGIGVAIGIIALRKVDEKNFGLGHEGLERAVAGITQGIYDFVDAVRVGMRERDTELRVALKASSAVQVPSDL